MRIAAFNIAAARYAPIEEIAAFVDAFEADVVLAQEVDRFTARSKGEDQHTILEQVLGSAQAYFSPSIGNALKGYYGTSIYLREPYAKNISRFNLTVKGDREPRFAIEATLTSQASNKCGIDIISNVHFSVRSSSAELQLESLLNRYADCDSFLIGGDFNLTSKMLERLGYPDADTTPTCGVPARIHKLDHFVAKTERTYHTRTVPSGHLSDHDAVLWEI